MSNGGKGHDRRPQEVDDQTFADNWDRIFAAKKDYYESVRAKNYEDSLRLEGLLGSGVTGSTTGSNPAGSRSSLDSPATYEEGHGNARKPTHKSLACSAAPSGSQGQDGQVQGEGQRLIYIDDATGQEVTEDWWPGDEI